MLPGCLLHLGVQIRNCSFSREAGNPAQDFKMLAWVLALGSFALRSPPCLSSVLFCILGVWPLQAPGWVVLSQQEALVGGGMGRGQGIGSSKGVALPISALGIISGKAPVSVTHQGSRLARSPQPPGSRYPAPAFFPPDLLACSSPV